MGIVFDGREFARKKEKLLRDKVAKLQSRGITPHLVSILVGDDPASVLYVSLKKKAAERIGARLEIRRWKIEDGSRKLIEEIRRLNKDQKVHGIMVQMPLPKAILNYSAKVGSRFAGQFSIINSIVREKDVDGLRDDSPFVPATVKAILEIIDNAKSVLNRNLNSKLFAVVGSEGVVGRPLVKELKRRNYEVVGIDLATSYILPAARGADVLISATGVHGLIKKDMVKKGAIVIDVGSPKGDISEDVAEKAAFVTPVPGGVGPVTIACLLENLVVAAEKFSELPTAK